MQADFRQKHSKLEGAEIVHAKPEMVSSDSPESSTVARPEERSTDHEGETSGDSREGGNGVDTSVDLASTSDSKVSNTTNRMSSWIKNFKKGDRKGRKMAGSFEESGNVMDTHS